MAEPELQSRHVALPALLKALQWLLVSPCSKRLRSWRDTLIISTAIIGLGVALVRPILDPRNQPMVFAGHPLQAFELAVNWVLCGKFPYLVKGGSHPHFWWDATMKPSNLVTREHTLRDYVANNADVLDVPVSRLPSAIRGSTENYCTDVAVPFINNENSLTYLFAGLLWLDNDVTLNELGSRLTAIRLIALSLVVLVLVRVGLSPVLTLVVFLAGVDVLETVSEYQLYSLYPFLLPTQLLYAAILALGLEGLGVQRWALVCLVLVVAGMFAAFYFNLRTSHLPFILAGFVIWAIFAYRQVRRGVGGTVKRGVSIILLYITGFSAGFAAAQLTSVVPAQQLVPTAERTYHVVAHPMVLALAIPKNPLAEREGIVWLDRVGLDLAHRIDPDVTYLGPGYEKALWTYYKSLWVSYPSQMARLYIDKWKLAGTGALASIHEEWKTARFLLWPLSLLENGFGITAVLGILLVGAFLCTGRVHDVALCMVALLATFGLLIEAEAALTYSFFEPAYQHPLVLCLSLVLILLYQMIINLCAGLVGTFGATPAEESRRTIRDFGKQWTTYNDTTGFFGSSALLADFIAPFSMENFRGSCVADIGAGTGRHVQALLDVGARRVIAIEPSESVRVIREQLVKPNIHRVIAMNITGDRLPPTGDLDYVISVGVLHHIPEPAPVIRAAYRALKPGGRFIVWIYGKEGNALYLLLATPLRWITKHVPHAAVGAIAWLLDIPLVFYIRLCHAMPRRRWPLKEYMTEILAKLPPDKRRLVIYDQLKPHYAKYYSRSEAVALMKEAPFQVEAHHRRAYSWVVIGTKPET